MQAATASPNGTSGSGISLPEKSAQTDPERPRTGRDWIQPIPSSIMRRPSSGFTLIEVAVTMAIMGVLAGLAIPSMQTFIERQRTSAAISSLLSHMSLARTAAISRNRRSVLCPSADGTNCEAGTDWSQGWMLFVDDDSNGYPDSSDDILRVDLEPTSRHLRVVSTRGRQQLRYLPDGRSAGANLTISICGQDGVVLGRVIVNNMGRPRSEHGTGQSCPG